MIHLADVEQARQVLGGTLHRTPVMESTRLGDAVGARLLLKAELFQKTGSFKPRGALNRVRRMSAAELERGIVAVSGGNHAQGIAFAAAEAGVPCTVVMPESTARVKVDATSGYGAEVVVHGDVDAAYAKVEEIRAATGATFVPPFDDPLVAAGQGTVGLEIVEDVPDVTVVVVPVGGGGLLSGVATAVKGLRPEVRVIGVEPEGAAAMRASFDAGRPVRLDHIDTFAMGLAAPFATELTYGVSRLRADDVVTVTDREIVRGMEALMTTAKLFPEGAGAAATAALLAGRIPVSAQDVVVPVVSGGNIDWPLLSRLIEEYG